jgi:hypothetical protein
MGLTNGKQTWGAYFDSVIFVGGGFHPPPPSETRMEINLPSVTSYVPGEVYVTGNWTSLTVTIEGVATLSGELTSGSVKYGSIEFSWTPPGQQTEIIDEDSGVSAPDPRADVNKDGFVDILDIYLVACSWGAEMGEERYDPKVDLNNDLVIDILDLVILAKDFGKLI